MRNNYASHFHFALPRFPWDGNISKSFGEKFIGGRGSKVRMGEAERSGRRGFVPVYLSAAGPDAAAEAGETH